MANGELIAEIRKLSESSKKIPAATRDRLILAAIADLYGKVDRMFLTYQIMAVLGGLFGSVFTGVLIALATGKLELVAH